MLEGQNVMLIQAMQPVPQMQVVQPMQGVPQQQQQQQGVQQWALVQAMPIVFFDEGFKAMVPNQAMEPAPVAVQAAPPQTHSLTRAARRRMRQRMRKKFGKTLDEMRAEAARHSEDDHQDEAPTTGGSAGHDEASMGEDSLDVDSMHEPAVLMQDFEIALPMRPMKEAIAEIAVPAITEVIANHIVDFNVLGGAFMKDVPVCAFQENKPMIESSSTTLVTISKPTEAIVEAAPSSKQPELISALSYSTGFDGAILVMNTFIHFAEHTDSHASRRSRSV